MEICQQIRLLVAAVLLQEFGGKHLWHMGSSVEYCGMLEPKYQVRVNASVTQQVLSGCLNRVVWSENRTPAIPTILSKDIS